MSTIQISAADLAALISAKLCHDLAGPVSALGAALSVLDDEGAADMRDDAIDLVRTGAKQAQAKLEFARLALGAGGSAPSVVDMAFIQKIADAMFAQNKPDLVWKTEAAGLQKPAARVLLNLIWLSIDSVPRGGTVTIEASATEGGSRLRVVAAGPRARLDGAYQQALIGEAPENGLDARSIQPYYTGLLAREAGGRAEARADDERVEFAALIATQAAEAA
ncbi:MAG: histidine phosphotransferase family protein [Pseudomonadota bacterium]